MSYHIYTTDGIILKRRGFGEANVLLFILTDELGLIMTSAQSARAVQSKLNSALQEYSLISLSCVKGKNGWKVTNAVSKENFYFDQPIFVQKLVSQLSEVLLRMMPGEEKHREVFSIVSSGFSELKNISENNIANFETLIMLRFLYHLGYIDKNSETEKFLQNYSDWGDGVLAEVSAPRLSLVSLINKGLKESQL